MTKPPLDYLRASGAVPISIVGGLIQWRGTAGVAATYWTSSAVAKPIVRRARAIMGAADLTATAALHQAALELKQTLTPHDIAIERAALASQQLDLYMASMQGIGILKLFNAEFKRRRVAAAASSARFITYATAMKRLRTALIPLLAGGKIGRRSGRAFLKACLVRKNCHRKLSTGYRSGKIDHCNYF